MPVLSKMRPVKCWDFANRRRFPVRFPRFTVIVPDFQRNNTQEGDYRKFKLTAMSESVPLKPPSTSQLRSSCTELSPDPTIHLLISFHKLVVVAKAIASQFDLSCPEKPKESRCPIADICWHIFGQRGGQSEGCLTHPRLCRIGFHSNVCRY